MTPEEYYKDNKLAISIIKEKYFAEGETSIEDIWLRLSKSIASTERGEELQTHWQKEFYEIMKDWKFVPAGRIITGGGVTKYKTTLSNCYCNPIDDTIWNGDEPSIYKCLIEHALTYKYGGGTSVNLSYLRPKDSPVEKSGGTSCGPVGFCELYSVNTRTIASGRNRRGALLITLRVDHPDIFEFVKLKQDPHACQNANLSVLITDEFMKAVKTNDNFNLRWQKGNDYAIHGNGIFYKTIKARELWDLIIECAWKSAEPGILFYDNIVKNFSTQYYKPFLNCNPCHRGSDLIITSNDGAMPYEQFVEFFNLTKHSQKHYINDDVGIPVKVLDAFCSGQNDVIEFKLYNGISIGVTPQHKLQKEDNKWISAEDLKVGDVLKRGLVAFQRKGEKDFKTYFINEIDKILENIDNNIRKNHCHQAKFIKQKIQNDNDYLVLFFELFGLIFGGGRLIKMQAEKTGYRLGITFSKSEKLLSGFKAKLKNLLGENQSCYIVDNKMSAEVNWQSGLLKLIYDKLGYTNKQHLPRCVYYIPQKYLIAFLRGLITADGSKTNSTNYFKLYTSKKAIADEITILMNELDCVTYITTSNTKTTFKRKEKSYNYRQKLYNIYFKSFNKQIVSWFLDDSTKYKKIIYKHSLESKEQYIRKQYTIKTIQHKSKEKVYDVKLFSDKHSYIVNNIISHNCGELPLSEYGNCNLSSINLSALVDEGSNFLLSDFKKIIPIAVRFLDDVVDYNYERHPLPQQKEESWQLRKVGLGVMGLADMLIKMKIKYDSFEAIKMVKKIFEILRNESYKASCMLAKEKGGFPAYHPEKFFQCCFINSLPEEIKKLIKDCGIRNASLTTIPPTGTTSIVAQTSSGIEPIFSKTSLIRRARRSDDPSKFDEFRMVHPLLKQYDEKNYPSYIVDAYDVSPQRRIALQAAIQQYIDSSISTTINLPEDVKKEVVDNLYQLAHQTKLKGLTVYRKGSRMEIIEKIT